jgi:hypothetical protein
MNYIFDSFHSLFLGRKEPEIQNFLLGKNYYFFKKVEFIGGKYLLSEIVCELEINSEDFLQGHFSIHFGENIYLMKMCCYSPSELGLNISSKPLQEEDLMYNIEDGYRNIIGIWSLEKDRYVPIFGRNIKGALN